MSKGQDTASDRRSALTSRGITGRLDDRWPDRLAAVMDAFAVLTLVGSLVPAWRRYFAESNDLISMLTIPIVPSWTYATLLVLMGVALRRRLTAGWWVFMLWWLVLPQLARIFEMASDFRWAELVGFVFILA